jgi:TolB protein
MLYNANSVLSHWCCFMSRLLRAFCLLIIASSIVITLLAQAGRRLPASIIAIDPLDDATRDIALRDLYRTLDIPIAQTEADERAPAWSPDGRQLAYLEILGGVQRLWVMDANGHNRRVLNTAIAGHPDTSALAWSPRGDSIAFTALAGNRQSIFIVSLANGAQRQLTATGSSASSPAWSPDGRELVFAWSLVANQEIFIADVDAVVEPLTHSTEVERVTSDYGMDAMPAWSPDGETIAFFSTRDGDSNIYLYDLTNQHLRQVTSEGTREIAPVWMPDGSALLYRSFQDDAWGIYRLPLDCLDSDGCTPIRILQGDYAVAWKP